MIFVNFGKPFRTSNDSYPLPKKLQYLSGSVETNAECLKLFVRDTIPLVLNLTLQNGLQEYKEQIPGLSDENWDEFSEILKTFVDKYRGLSDAFLDKFSGILNDFLHNFPGKWDVFWEKSPGMLEDFQDKFPKTSGEFWKLFPWFLGELLKATFSDSMLCINYPEGNACKGDSGGPLVAKHAEADGVTPGQNYEQIGVPSLLGTIVCNSPSWTMYGRVTSVVGWIKDSVGSGHTDCDRD